MNSLPLVANRQTPSVESREHYNVKARGLTWASAGKSWKVDTEKIIHDSSQSDEILWDTVLKKSRTHNKYFPRHHSKVNKNWRPPKNDLDREQYNHLRIPVNHSVSWMAPVFERRGDKEQKSQDMTILEQKYIQPEDKLLKSSCRTQATAIDRTKYTPIDVAMPDLLDVTYVNRQASRKDKRHLMTESRVDDRLLRDDTLDIQRRANRRVKRENSQSTAIDAEGMIIERAAYDQQAKIRTQTSKFDHTPVLDVRMNDNKHEVTVNSNVTMPNKKYSSDYDTTSKVQEDMLQTSIALTGGRNRNDPHHPTYTLDRKASEDVGMFEVRTSMPTFERHTPQFSAIKS